jgi:pimeloyl-ACP methyl ester carboxylesterase
MRLMVQLAITLAVAGYSVIGMAEDKFFDSDGVRIRYIEEGSGEPVVLIHGSSGTAETWKLSGVFQRLAKNYRVIAMDCRGSGKSDKPLDPKLYGRNMTLDIVRLLDHLEIERAHIVGYSMGGSLTLQLATLKPERFLSATLGAAAGRVDWTEEVIEQVNKRADRIENTPAREIVLRHWPKDKPKPSEEEIEKLVAKYLAFRDPKALAAVRRSYRDQVVAKEEVARIKVPFLSIIGTADPSLEAVNNLKKSMPKLKIVAIEGATHAGEKSAKRHPQFVQALEEFLKENEK